MSVAAVVRAQVIAPLTECLPRALKAATRNGQRRNGETTHEENSETKTGWIRCLRTSAGL